MKDLVIDLVACCENRISMVEELITSAYYSTVPLDVSLSEVTEERSKLNSYLKDLLARNCSLRKKDFNTLIGKTVSETEVKKKQIEEERRLVRAELEDYVSRQKQMAISLRQQLVEFHDGKDTGGLETTVESFKAVYQERGQAVFALLRDFQLHLEGFQREQQEINHELRALVNKGESLRVEDLRQLRAARADLVRKAERRSRRNEVERLLAQFRQQRQGEGRCEYQ